MGATLVVASLLGFFTTPASLAAITHDPLFQLAGIPAEGPLGEHIADPGPLGKMESMTVDSGHLWVAEGSNQEPSRVDEFEAKTGRFIGQPISFPAPPEAEYDRPTCLGFGCGRGIAVGDGLGEAAIYVGGESHGVSVVDVFNEAGSLKGTWDGAGVPGGSFGVFLEKGGRRAGTVTDVAVDNSTSPLDAGAGDVYVDVEEQHVIDVFHPQSNGEERYVGQITGISPSEPFRQPTNVAVEPNGNVLVADFLYNPSESSASESQIDEFQPTGLGGYSFVREIAGPPPDGTFAKAEALTTDAGSGDIYVADYSSGANGYRIEQFSSAGAYLGHVDNIPDPYAIAVDPATHYLYARATVYGPGLVIPDVTTDPPASLKPESAVLSGSVNPDGAGKATCQFDWGTSPSLENSVPCSAEVSDGEAAVPVQATLSELERGVTYYYRLEATNANGSNKGEPWQTESFTTPGAIIREISASGVNADSVTLLATIDPANQPTRYYFQYGPTVEYGQQIPAAPEPIGSGGANVEVPDKRLQGLSPGTEYHYRLVVVSEAKPGELETVYSIDRTFTTQAAKATGGLPDGRAWELVTPAEKRGALFFAQNVAQLEGVAVRPFVAEASSAGNAMVNLASAPTEAQPQGNGAEVSVLSTRGSEGWTSKVIALPHHGGTGTALDLGSEYKFFSEDLSRAIVEQFGAFLPLSPEASEPTPYLRTNYTAGDVNTPCAAACYRPLVTPANASSGVAFGGETVPGLGCKTICGPKFVDATPDANYVALYSGVQLTSAPFESVSGEGGVYHYEWGDGRLQPLYLLPANEGGVGVNGALGLIGHQLADNGSVFFTYKKHLYLHDFAHAMSVRLDVAQGVSEPPTGGAAFLYASIDGSRVLFSDPERLTSAERGGIYECRIVESNGVPKCELTLTPLTGGELIDGGKNASYVYLLGPEGKLDVGHYEHGTWTNTYGPYVGPLIRTQAEKTLSTETSPDGRYLTFMSDQELTGYDNHDGISGQPDVEVYLYDALANKLVCASCNPTGARPVGVKLSPSDLVAGSVPQEAWTAADLPPWTAVYPSDVAVGKSTVDRYEPRFLSDGGRLFFNSRDALVPQDVNGQQDVYEYEPPGEGDCTAVSSTYSVRSGGCVRMISAGSSGEESAFMDASEDGGDAFFITLSKLAPQDFDNALDVYDAHECTSAVPCPASPPPVLPPCKTGDSCKAAPTPQPSIFGEPPSATFSGVGNVTAGGTAETLKKAKQRSSTNARKLAHALQACKKQRGKRRMACRRAARKRYGKTTSRATRARAGKRG